MTEIRKARRFVEFTFSVKDSDAGEFGESFGVTGYVDINAIESFYEDGDGTFLTTEFDEFKVMHPPEEVLRILNERE